MAANDTWPAWQPQRESNISVSSYSMALWLPAERKLASAYGSLRHQRGSCEIM
jgi:hypothetical protein